MFPWCCYILLQVAPFSFFARKLLLRGNGDISFEGGELCNRVPVRDSYFEGAERKCLRVGRCFDCVGSSGNKVDRPVQRMELTDSSL